MLASPDASVVYGPPLIRAGDMPERAAGASRVESTAKPFLKWAGGKRALLPQLRKLLPPDVAHKRYLEPFVGGGALFFEVGPQEAVLADINEALVASYQVVRDNPALLITCLRELELGHCDRQFYAVRDHYNATSEIPGSIERVAEFIYLNKTCFNGLHRVNRDGHFNVPVGRYAKPVIVDERGLLAAGWALAGVSLRCESFEAVLDYARLGDFVYFDPPYAPVSDTAYFTQYSRDRFGVDEQLALQRVFAALDSRGCMLMLSNADVSWVRDLYRDYCVECVAARRSINCNAAKRESVTELVVRNYC